MCVEQMTEADWPAVEAIYREGIATGHATFATAPPNSWATWSAGKINVCSLVARAGDQVIGWAAVSPTSARACYAGVAEHSVYITAAARGTGVGALLMTELIRVTEAAGIWMLQSSIFPENGASRRLHARCGFREVGVRERIALMTYGPLEGRWRDTILLERRSATVGT
ncbi:MAG: N-acetyltransferase [Chloroflexales bacterium]|nr:N-acetyltransferase [Chloroflexales bacterium]